MEQENKNGSYYANTREEMLDFIPVECRHILEVGCGEGKFGLLLKSRNEAEVWGAELMEEPAKTAKKNLDKVLVGDFEEQIKNLPKKYFDCIVFNDALEHLKDHYNVLRELRKCLIDGGTIACSIPNVRYYKVLIEILFKKEFHYVHAGVLDYTHYRFFTKKSIVRTFEDCGYEIVKIRGLRGVKKWPLIKKVLFFFLGDKKFVQYGVTARAV